MVVAGAKRNVGTGTSLALSESSEIEETVVLARRKPEDLDAFSVKIVEEFAEGVHEGQRESVSATPSG